MAQVAERGGEELKEVSEVFSGHDRNLPRRIFHWGHPRAKRCVYHAQVFSLVQADVVELQQG
jgi:hypothetical protein